MSLSNSYLQNLAKQYEELKTYSSKITTDLTEEQFNTKPAENSWSVAECFEHLYATWDSYHDAIKSAIEKNTNESVKHFDNYSPRFLQKKFISMLEPPYKFKMKTFSIFLPSKKLNMNETLDKFVQGVDSFIQLIHDAEKTDIANTIIVSPVSKFIKFQAGEIFPFLEAHARRHLWQAEQVIKLISTK